MKDVIEFGLRGWMYASLSGTIGLIVWSARESLASHRCKDEAQGCKAAKGWRTRK